MLGRFEPATDITIPGYASCCVRKELRIAVGKYRMRAISEKQKEKKHSIFVAAELYIVSTLEHCVLAVNDFSTKLSSFGVNFVSESSYTCISLPVLTLYLGMLCNFALLCAKKTCQVLEIQLQKCFIYS